MRRSSARDGRTRQSAAVAAALAALLAAGPLAAQQTQSGDVFGTIPQPHYDPQAGAEAGAETGAEAGADLRTAAQGATAESAARFVRAPSDGTFVVTPLAPPGGTATTPPSGAEPSTTAAPGTAVPGADGGTGGGTDGGAVFRTAPDDGIGDPGGRWERGGIAVPIDQPPTEMRPGVVLRELDKMTGQTQTFAVAVGETRQIDRLIVTVDACRSPESNDRHGTIAFLKVSDAREPDAEAFSGWMFAQSPSLSAMDDPRYDLWVISCTTSDAATSSASE